MKKFSSILAKLGSLVAAFVLFVGVASAQPYCVLYFHQPKIPQGMSKFTGKNIN